MTINVTEESAMRGNLGFRDRREVRRYLDTFNKTRGLRAGDMANIQESMQTDSEFDWFDQNGLDDFEGEFRN